MSEVVFDSRGRRRSPATMAGYLAGRPPRNKGRRYPADPPRVEEIVAVMRAAGDRPCATRLRGLIIVLWRAGLRVGEALTLAESDLDPARGAILVRHGKGDKRREAGMDDWAWGQLAPWISARQALPVGPLFCIVVGATAGGPWSSTAVRSEFRAIGRRAGVRPRRRRSARVRECGSSRHAEPGLWSVSAETAQSDDTVTLPLFIPSGSRHSIAVDVAGVASSWDGRTLV